MSLRRRVRWPLAGRRFCAAVVALALVILWVGTGIAQSADTARLLNVGVAVDGQQTQVTFSFSHVPPSNAFVLSDPVRAVLDLQNTTKSADVASASGGAVHDMRWGRRPNGGLRAVMDLQPGAEFVGMHQQNDSLVEVFKGGVNGASSHAATTSGAAIPAPRQNPIVVVIDPGHGGKDPGTTAADGLHEKNVVLAIGKLLYAKLKNTSGIEPIMTRSTDRFVSLAKRVAIAQQHHADLFISIHANAAPYDDKVAGGTCYTLSEHGASNAEAAQLARFENSRDRDVAGVQFSRDNMQLNSVLTQMFQNASIDAADRLAHRIIGQFSQVEPIYRGQVPHANFEVLRNPMTASVLCETAFLSNPHQADQLATPQFREALATAMYKGIMGYLTHNPPMREQTPGRDVYIVKAGDTLDSIASRAGTTAPLLMAVNDLSSRKLAPGQRLIVPGLSGADTQS